MFYKITKTLTVLLFLAVLSFTYSCNDALEVDQEPKAETSMELAIEELNEIIASRKKDKKHLEVDLINGKTSADYYREWQKYIGSTSRGFCEETPNCPKVTVNGVFNFNAGCDFAYSYELYNCGSGNIAIFNFQMAPTPGSNCFAYDWLVTQTYNNGDLTTYQKYANIFAVIVLSDIEDALYNSSGSTVGQTVITSYIPNICAAVCSSNGAQVECGEDCCIRFAIYDYPSGDRTTSVFSAGECGGDLYTCIPPPIVSECKNFDCVSLNEYR